MSTIQLWSPKEDIHTVFEFLLRYQKDNSEFVSEPNIYKVRKYLADAVLLKEPIYVLKDGSGIIRGIFSLTTVEEWWSDKKFVYNKVWYVEKPYRTLKNLTGFLDYAKKYATMVGLELIVELPYSSVNINKAAKVLTKKYGFNQTGGLFKYG